MGASFLLFLNLVIIILTALLALVAVFVGAMFLGWVYNGVKKLIKAFKKEK